MSDDEDSGFGGPRGYVPHGGARTANPPPAWLIAGALPNMMLSAGRGAAKTTLGWGGDLEKLVAPDERNFFPTSKEVGDVLPRIPSPRSGPHPEPYGLQDLKDFFVPRERTLSSLVKPGEEEPEHPYETVGSFMMLSPKQVASAGKRGLSLLRDAVENPRAAALARALREGT
jgi:hypothetical protein